MFFSIVVGGGEVPRTQQQARACGSIPRHNQPVPRHCGMWPLFWGVLLDSCFVCLFVCLYFSQVFFFLVTHLSHHAQLDGSRVPVVAGQRSVLQQSMEAVFPHGRQLRSPSRCERIQARRHVYGALAHSRRRRLGVCKGAQPCFPFNFIFPSSISHYGWQIDVHRGGFVLFGDFCKWFAQKFMPEAFQ